MQNHLYKRDIQALNQRTGYHELTRLLFAQDAMILQKMPSPL
jgi:hypothetical protein